MRRGPANQQGNASVLPAHTGPADVLPAYMLADGGVVVVRAEETSVHGEAPQELSRTSVLEDNRLTEQCQIVVQPYHDPVLQLQTRLARKG